MDDSHRGGCCGVIFLLLVVWGGFQLYQRFDGPSSCDGWNEWAKASEERFNDAIGRTEQLNLYTSTPIEIMELVKTFRDDADDQRNSGPPEAGRELSDASATFYSMMANMYEAIALDKPLPYSEQQLSNQSDKVTEFMNEANESCSGWQGWW